MVEQVGGQSEDLHRQFVPEGHCQRPVHTVQCLGRVESAEMVRDDHTGDTHGFGLALMPSRPEVTSAITALQLRNLKELQLEVKESRLAPRRSRAAAATARMTERAPNDGE